MMNCYRSRKTRADDYYYDPTAGVTIEVCDHEPRFTGLLDADGNEIWCEPNPIGFHHPLDDGFSPKTTSYAPPQ
jgi:hypothetical protein